MAVRRHRSATTSGTYRFDRLVPGTYHVKFELQGFRTVDRPDVRISAAFVATINGKMEVGSVSETITVTGESPTVDVRSNLQQTVMNQEILEGIPTGRDPWSLAKLIPGVQVATYDVGGTQSMQQSSMSAHGSNTADVSYNIDGATVNWPGGGGGATMIYYDQGMFEEVNYMTSAIPAEQLVGGVSINMVTKDGGNLWRGNARYNFSNDELQARTGTTPLTTCASINPAAMFLGNPTKKTYDFNLSGGGALVQNRVWVNGTIRRWIVNKLVNARNADGSQALDDNTLKNYSGKVVAQADDQQQDHRRLLLERQDPRPSPRQHDADHSRHRLGRADQPGADDAGEVHRHPRTAGVRVELQRHGRPDQLHLPARHRGRRDSLRRQRDR